jgi:hypothetical protein
MGLAVGERVMAKLWDFLTGGNIKVAANAVADLYASSNGDYLKTFEYKCLSLMGQMSQARNDTLGYLLSINGIRNLSELVVAELNTFAAPAGTPFEHTKEDFLGKVQSVLRVRGIPEKYVSGDNTHLTAVNEPEQSEAPRKAPNVDRADNQKKLSQKTLPEQGTLIGSSSAEFIHVPPSSPTSEPESDVERLISKYGRDLLIGAADTITIGSLSQKFSHLSINPTRAEAQFIDIYQDDQDWLLSLGGWHGFKSIHEKMEELKLNKGESDIFAAGKKHVRESAKNGVGGMLAFYVGAATESAFIRTGIYSLVSFEHPESAESKAFLSFISSHQNGDFWNEVHAKLTKKWISWNGL